MEDHDPLIPLEGGNGALVAPLIEEGTELSSSTFKESAASADRFSSSDTLGSTELAQLLRSGPVRVTLDRLVRALSDSLGIEYMVLGLRHHNQYEFIATFGLPLSGYSDRVPAGRMGTSLFDREVEVADLQKEANFVVLDVVPVAKHWRYGVNAPVRLVTPLADGGVLALSGASLKLIQTGGKALGLMRLFADIIADLVWLAVQIRSARTHAKTIEVVSNVLISSIKSSPFPLVIIDDNLCAVGFSPRFVNDQKRYTGSAPVPGTSIADVWLDADAQRAVGQSFATGKPLIAVPTIVPGTETELWFDFHRLAYNDVPSPFGILGFHRPNDNVDFVRGRSASLAAGPKPKSEGGAGSLGFSEGGAPLTRFLLDTLPHRHRLLKRGEQRYIAVRTWRKSIKAHQISALKALKSAPPEQFVDIIADEMIDVVTSTYGDVSGCTVVPVPCGHSGPECLACRVGKRIAEKLAIGFAQAFNYQPVTGSSHPKANAKRPKMQRNETVLNGPVILIDDVATSGVHLEEAAKLLKAAGTVWPVVWIAD